MKKYRFNKWLMVVLCAWAFLFFQIGLNHQTASAATIIDHTCTDLTKIPQSAIEVAKTNLHIAYGHTSHGNQLIVGMTGLVGFINDHGLGLTFPNNFFAWNNGGTNGALDLRDTPFSGASDLGNPNRTAWATATRNYLDAHTDINVIIWSWCGQADTSNPADIDTYLNLMNHLETDYPNVKFVYMTGHLAGTGPTGNLNQRNTQIRNYCNTNNKILYDFADIESYDPDGLTHYMPLMCNDNCDYVLNGSSHNWALDWQNSHEVNVDWYNCSPDHTQPLNGNRKAYAAWWLWARLAGWNGVPGATYTISGTITHESSALSGVTMTGLPGSPVTDAFGAYSGVVNEGTSYTVTPTLTGYTFDPTYIDYPAIASNQTDQDYTATPIPTCTISGRVTLNGAGLAGVNMGGFPAATITDSTGEYTATVNQGSTLTVTPSLSGYTFTPPNQIYTNVTTNQTNQNFTAAANSSVTPGAGGGGGGGCFINASTNGLPLGLLSFALLLLMTIIRHVKTRRKAVSRSTELF